MTRILVIEDEDRLRNLLHESIALEGHAVESVSSAEEARLICENTKFDVLLTDVNLPGQSGIEFLPIFARFNPGAYMLVITGFATVDTAVKAMKYGAADFLCKPISLRDLSGAIKIAVDKLARRPTAEILNVSNSPLIAKSAVMLQLIEEIKTIAPYKINVLVTGETGTGKELVARAVHSQSPRARKDFIALNCAAIPEQLLEDELFGHVKGAFTGAQTDRKGRFEQADGGTLFLDEIGDMNLTLQSKLLRVLQESEFEKLGSAKSIKVDVRVIAATSANLDAKLADGSFRADLYHRLNVVRLHIPPLRARADDILPIAAGLLEKFCRTAGLPDKYITEDAAAALNGYSFPGNVRQLQNAMERAAVFSGASSQINASHLPEEFKAAAPHYASPDINFALSTDQSPSFSDVVFQVERDLLLQTLEKTGGNKMQAAKLLNMKRTTLIEKIKRLNIEGKETEK